MTRILIPFLPLALIMAVGCNPLPATSSPHLAVDAGEDQSIEEGQRTTLSASVGGRTDNFAFRWDQQTGLEVAMEDPTAPTTEIGPITVLGDYKFRVVASTPDRRFGQDVVTVTVVAEGQLNDNESPENNENATENDNEAENENEDDNENADANENTDENENEAENENADDNENEQPNDNADDNENANDNVPDVDPILPGEVVMRANAPDEASVDLAAPLTATEPPDGVEAEYLWEVVTGNATIRNADEREARLDAEAPGVVTVRCTMTVPQQDLVLEDETDVRFVEEGAFTIYVVGPNSILAGQIGTYTATFINVASGSLVQHNWELVEGDGVFGRPDQRQTGFATNETGVMTIRLLGSINDEPVIPDEHQVVVYPNPTVGLTGQTENFAMMVELTEISVTSTNFDDDELNWDWRVVDGLAILEEKDTPSPLVRVAEAGTVELEVTAEGVIDGLERSGSMTVYVTGARSFHPVVEIIVQDFGTIPIELDAEVAPTTVANFLHYVDDGFYNNAVFHRVVDGFVIQTGGSRLVDDEVVDIPSEEFRFPIPNEAENAPSNLRGTLSMALPTDAPDQGTSQVFINLVDNDFLDELLHTVFGEVIEDGMDVVDAISEVEVDESDAPVDPVVITRIRRQRPAVEPPTEL